MKPKTKKKQNKSPLLNQNKTKKKSVFKKIKHFFGFYTPHSLHNSYTPTINRKLVTVKTRKRVEIKDCNNKDAFDLKEPLKIAVPGYLYGKYCVPYYENTAKKYLLKQLAANKHVDPSKIIPPKQLLSNCWFNAMFVTFFVSDKGRKFFHFFRNLMITGKQADGSSVEPEKLRDAFALLNFGVEAALTGNKFAQTLNTNAIIRKVYDAIPSSYKDTAYLRDIKQSGNPLLYYMSIVNYLNNKSIDIYFVRNATVNWREDLNKQITKVPHVIVVEVLADDAPHIKNKPITMQVHNKTYAIDSAVIRDTTGRHFSTVLTAEKRQMGYDGLSYHRLKPLEWKWRLNKDSGWGFPGSETAAGVPLQWNFMKGYQLLFYYRISR
jgi:hypothetical protein